MDKIGESVMRGFLMLAGLLGFFGLASAAVVESQRELAVLQEVDVLVLGGGSGAVQAAQTAAACGASVFLAAPRPYLGDDLAGTLRLRLAADAAPQTALCKALYTRQQEAGAPLRPLTHTYSVKPEEVKPDSHADRLKDGRWDSEVNPLKVKKTFDAALLQAGVPFLTGCFATEPLLDADGRVAGAVVADKSGRQAVIAKVVIDATERAEVCRLAGAQARPFPAGAYTFSRMVIAGEAPKADGLKVSERFGLYGAPVGKDKIQGRLFECEMALPMKDDSPASFAAAEQQARDMTFVPSVLDSADRLFFVPPNPLVGERTVAAETADAAAIDLGAFRPKGVAHVFVLGAMADVSRPAARALMEPARAMTLGERIGAAAAEEAKARGALKGVRLAANAAQPAASVKTQDIPGTISVRYIATSSARVAAEARELPELAACDVLVVGAGTGGAPAAIAAARQGAKVLVCDYLYHMGGVQTVGLIGGYYFGNIVGFTKEIDAGVAKTAQVKVMAKSEWYRRQCRTSGAEIWYGTMATGAVREGDVLTGVIVVAPDGRRGVIRAKAVIDGTGNADIAAAAGEETEYMRADELAIQGAGNAPRRLGSSGANSDIGFVDETDAADLCFFALRSRVSLPATLWDQAQNVNSRERRRLVGAFYVTPLDVLNRRTYPDTVMQSHSDLDSHGYTVHENFLIADFGRKKFFGANLPYRALLPKRLDGLLVIGLGVSAHRDAMPVLRMQPDIQNEGYAAGYAAAMAVKGNVPLRAVDVKALQKHLVEIKNLDPSVLTARDSFPLTDAQVNAAVEGIADLTNHYEAVAVVLAEPQRALPLLEAAYRQAGSEAAKLSYAQVLGIMGNPLGGETLIAKVEASEWDAGWQFKGMSQFGRSVSWIDSYLLALGRSRVKPAFPAMKRKAEALTEESAFSHFRAVAMAFERLGDPAAAPVLAAVLDRPGIRGNAFKIGPTVPEVPGHANAAADLERSKCLREIALARALFRLGDHEGKGRTVLQAYAEDPRGVYARHAQAVLAERQ
jgi:ribulose 1,5-bisphosphate synthetase/thiazole synthase